MKYYLLMDGKIVKTYKTYQKHQFYKYSIQFRDHSFKLVKACLETQSW